MPALATATKGNRTVVYGYAKTEKSKYYLLIETEEVGKGSSRPRGDKEVLRKSKPASKSAKASFSKETSSY